MGHIPALAKTDLYEFTMLDSMVGEGIADHPATFEAFARRLPEGRRFGLVVGQGRLRPMLDEMLEPMTTIARELRDRGHVGEATVSWLDGLAHDGWGLDVDAFREGSVYWPGDPVLQVRGRLGEGVLLETLVLSVLNHDSAVASAAARMRIAAGDAPLIEMGSRRVHEDAASAAARAAHIGGFDSTSNLGAGLRWDIPVAGTAAHAWTLAHGEEFEAFCAQLRSKGRDTTLLVDTFDTDEGIRNACRAARQTLDVPGPRAIRIDSGDPSVESRRARDLLDSLGAHDTRITLTGDMDEYIISGLLADGVPADGFGVGTRVATGSGHPSAGFVYKLVEVDRGDGPVPVAKKSASKTSVGGRKYPWAHAWPNPLEHHFSRTDDAPLARSLYRPLMASGWTVDAERWDTHDARRHAEASIANLGPDADLTHGTPSRTATEKGYFA